MYSHEKTDQKYRSRLSVVEELRNPFKSGYVPAGPEDKARKVDLQLHYLEHGVVAHTDLTDIGLLPPEFSPYTIHGRKPTIMHEEIHIIRHHQNRPQNERSINREVIYLLGLTAFPFPSY